VERGGAVAKKPSGLYDVVVRFAVKASSPEEALELWDAGKCVLQEVEDIREVL
jgi:hypothetical protein